MATADTLLLVAAEAREFAGLLKRVPSKELAGTGAAFAREVQLGGRRAILLANGPGPRSVNQMLKDFVKEDVAEVVSTGFCGALDPALKVGDIIAVGAAEDGIWSEDRVAVSAEEKRQLRERTGSKVVEMEYAAVAAKAAEWGVPCRAIRVVSDTAQEDLPLDFNRYRDDAGRFQLTRIAVAGLMRPFSALPELMRLDRQSRFASEKLGEFLANCKF
jgi:adenosylhomocysteine nucleosidase